MKRETPPSMDEDVACGLLLPSLRFATVFGMDEGVTLCQSWLFGRLVKDEMRSTAGGTAFADTEDMAGGALAEREWFRSREAMSSWSARPRVSSVDPTLLIC